MNKTPTTLIIMDGFGIRDSQVGNAVKAAATPNLDAILASNPQCRLSASGLDVGLPAGQMGNSEVGHTNIGAGRVVFQDLPRITRSIEDGSFFRNPAYLSAMQACKEKGTALHLMGLLSDGGVHSHITHLFAFLKMAKEQGLEKVYIHCFLDGRDVSPTSGKDFVQATVDECKAVGVGQIATVMGRFYAMDRDNRWDRVERAYAAMVYGNAPVETDPVRAVSISYQAGVTDEFVEPVVCAQGAEITEGDSIIFFNFRPDRARELTRAFVDDAFTGFDRKLGRFPVQYVCTTEYDATMPNVSVAFPRQKLTNIFGEYISNLGLTQLRIAETEKYAHVTFFFNGGVEQVFPGEDRVLIPSPKVATYDLQPEMSAEAVADACVERIESGKYDVIILNFANCDMVGHTGVFDAAVKAVETVDAQVARVVQATSDMGGVSLITADHGNAEQMLQEDGVSPYTAHTTNLVPLCIVGANVALRDGRLADIAPTMLDLMGLERPEEMDGETLIVDG
jgi:2,3-bisphosphoglycerate-independent phosphoglycerate mutase